MNQCSYEDQGLLHEMFRHQARAEPNKLALVGVDGHHMTYKELDDCTDVLACKLQRCGVKADSLVGIYMEKCVEYTVSYIAALKAGGAYMPLDISYPTALLDSIVEDAQPNVILTKEDIAPNLGDAENVIVLSSGWKERLTDEQNVRSTSSLHPEHMCQGLDNLAYVVYSSGTTGKPKGITCPHRGAVFSYNYRYKEYPYEPDDREACNVFFVWEMLRPLCKGIPMYIIPDSVIYDPPLLCKYIKTNHITRMLFTPSLLESVLNTDDIDFNQCMKSLRQIWFCGEVVSTSLLSKCMQMLSWVRFINLYSVSECHDVACEDLTLYYSNNKSELQQRKFCPVGQLLPGVDMYIMDDELQVQPVGMSGEIVVGGPTLAHGYINRPELDAKKFVRLLDTGQRVYRTGDWGYSLSDGRLEICGRCDSMVKIRGYSIEVQAVEAALLELTMVHACVVLVQGEEGTDRFLTAYIVSQDASNKKEIRAALKRKLPFYMIPSYFVLLNSIPVLAATGKLDKSALPPFDQTSDTDFDDECQPSTELECKLASLWKDVLQVKRIDVQESFFDLGGHSLLATQLMCKIRDKFSIAISVSELFFYPTVTSLARLIEAKSSSNSTAMDDARVVTLPSPPGIELRKEVERHNHGVCNIDMQLRAFWRSFRYGDRWKKSRVLLTGATGFLGSFLLKELLLQTATHVYCVVRELPDMTPMDRVKATLKQFGIIATHDDDVSDGQSVIKELLSVRVTAIKGDVSLQMLGMNEDDYNYLCTEVDFVLHAAAVVNLIYPYSALHGPNVQGTENILVFACAGKVKPVHYISTDAVFPHGLSDCSEDTDIATFHDQLTDGYSQSKWVAEQLVTRAGKRGVPVVIYRLGNLAGDRVTAYWNPYDFTLLMFQTCAMLGLAPDLHWKMEMTPVDFAAEIIVRLTQNVQLAIGKVFHIINAKPLDCRWLYEWMSTHGYALKIISYEDWCHRVIETSQIDNGNSLLPRLIETMAKDASYFSNLTTFTNHNLVNVLKQLSMTYPTLDAKLLQTYFNGLSKLHVIPRPRRNTSSLENKPLLGRVVIVTGASSGIGAATSIALARAGASVAMAARRTDRLMEVKSSIEKEGGVAICCKTDVVNRQQVKELNCHVESSLGPVDILVNSAGVMYYTLMKNLHEDEWDTMIDVNCKGVNNCIAAVLPGMLKRSSGHIVNISSDAGRRGYAGLGVYSGTKFYVEGVSQALRQEVSTSGIRVTCVQPGNTRTELFGLTTDTEAQTTYDTSSSNKILEPEDIARAILYAVTQPEYVSVNEILVEPRTEPI